jgi:hypothetical protein|tara:strand:+ start:1222 stop:1707 length:486 start_codon:yes stop_codon:yes gene_type:complete
MAMEQSMSFESLSPRMAVLAIALAMSGTALAHHGVTGRYDASQPILISGIVTQTTFSPPHPVLAVRVVAGQGSSQGLGRPEEYFGPVEARPQDLDQVLEIELSPVRTFYDLEETLWPGNEVTLVALRNCRPPHQLRSTWLRLRDGTVVSYDGDWAPGVDGC